MANEGEERSLRRGKEKLSMDLLEFLSFAVQINFIDFSSSFYPFLLFFVSSGALEESVQQIVGSDKFLCSVEFAFISRLCA